MTAAHAVRDSASLPFGLYADVYDLLYRDKDYAAESRFVARLIGRFGAAGPGARVVDLSCGTGRHAIELARLGFRVSGSDISERMIEMARVAAGREGMDIPLRVAPMQRCAEWGTGFDAALGMFASFGYLVEQDDLLSAMRGARRLLAPGGLLIFDVWNGEAVVRQYSPMRQKDATGDRCQVSRISRTTIDQARHVATVDFRFRVAPSGGAPLEFSERHLVRYFFADALGTLLESAGFETVARCPFLDETRELTPADWNMTFVARNPSPGPR